MYEPERAAEHGVLLLVEDDPDHAFLVRRRLAEHAGMDLPVVHLTTVAEARDRMAPGDVRCVVLDLSLPDASGMQALQAIRDADPTVPIVVLTGLDSDRAGLEALQLGAQDYLVKGHHAADALARSVLFAIERTRRHEAEQRQALLGRRLEVREAQLCEAQRLARLGSWEWDVSTGEVSWSEELLRLTGVRDTRGPAAFDQYLALVAAEDRPEAQRLFRLDAAGQTPVVTRHRLNRPDGTVRWVRGQMTTVAWDSAGRPARVLGTIQDITEQKHNEDLLEHQALHDGLTGLANRGVLLDRLRRVLAARSQLPALVAVVFLDLDRFKWVNDSRSHSAGDRLLVAVARQLEKVLRPTDTLARFGGDEFVVLCEQLHEEAEVLTVVERITAALAEPFAELEDPGGELEGVRVTASMGVAMAQSGTGADAELLVRDADIAMYRAKERGRSRCEIFDEAMRARATARLQTQSDLWQALHEEQIEAHFQPIVDVATGLVTGCEALARWRHPTRGLLLPGEFIPQAEETGLIVSLGLSVLKQACAAVAAWNRQRRRSLTVSVNLSARQLVHGEVVDAVRDALTASGLSPEALCLEVTESVVMEDPVASGLVLGRLRQLGVSIAIDDFGTGYSSLAYLLSLPVDVLKVDRSFVAAVDDGGAGIAIVTAVLALARSLGLSVVAEGVESVDQARTLQALGVAAAQGWLWSKATPLTDSGWALSEDPIGPGGLPVLPVPASRVPTADESRVPLSGARAGHPGGS